MGIYIITAVVLVVCLIFSWLAGSLLHLQGTSLWVLRGSLSLLCIAGAALFLWFHRKVQNEASGSDAGAAAGTEIDVLLREADRKLKTSKSASGSIASLPLIFILGESGSAKTSVMMHSGLEPELLAGRVYDGAEVAPTESINVWFARKTVFIEVGAKIAAESGGWMRLLQKTRPSQLKSAFGKGVLAARATLVCFDCEKFASGSDASAATARRLAARLREMAASLGADFPIYSLFTRMDRLPHFIEYVSNLTSAESGEILGATLLRRTGSQGLFVEEENNRINRTFDQLVYSLSEKRLDYLTRESAPERLPAVYEFPREVRKLRNAVAQFLVELTKPTQLGANCFLRGFYFSGVRPVIVSESVAMAAPVAASASAAGATRMFKSSDLQAQAAPARVMQSRKVPEWSFLPHLFNEVILRDRAALGASSQSAHVHTARRILIACAMLICLVVLGWATVSFVNNRALEQSFATSAETLSRSVPAPVDSPSVAQLQELEKLRVSLSELQTYNKDGAPFSYRLGLYSGDRIYPDAHKLYFLYFQRLLLYGTQVNMLTSLRQPPATRGSDDFQQMYGTLKSYLITTSHHEKADWNGLVPALLERSGAFRRADPATQELIRKQYAFYAGELLAENPYSSSADSAAVERSRAYLKQFNGIEAIYQAMLADAGRGRASVNFNRQFPGSALAVVDGYEVPASFTKDAFAVMQNSVQNPDKFSGEEWVTGPQGSLNIPLDSLRTQLAARYYSDYAAQWRSFLRGAHVVGYGSNLREASAKMARLIANDSPLLGLFWLAKENTGVEAPPVREIFGAVQTLAKDATPATLVVPGNQAYMGALTQLQAMLTAASSTPSPDPAALQQALQAATGARGSVTQIAQSFRIDAQGHIDAQVKHLLEEPITQAEGALRAQGPGGAEDICKAVNAVVYKYPFNPRATQQATLQEVQDVFRPQSGTLWALYDAKLKSVLLRQGNTFIVSGGLPIPARFVAFMGKAAQFTDTLFPGGSQTIHTTFTLRPVPAKGIDQATVVIDGQTLTGAAPKQFVWTGLEAGSASITVTSGSQTIPYSEQGPWALFKFFGGADWVGPSTLEFPLQQQTQLGRHAVSESAHTAARFEIDMQGAQIFNKNGFLEGLRCSAK